MNIAKSDDTSIEKFIDELKEANVYNVLNKDLLSDPNENYQKIEKIVTECREKHLPMRTVKFNKHRHKNSSWITSGIIKSIQSRDKLYLKLKKPPVNSTQHAAYKLNLKSHNNLLNKLIMCAKKDYYHTEFMKYKRDVKNTWRTINNLLCRKNRKSNDPVHLKVFSKDITNKKEIAEEFNNYFTSIGPRLSNSIPNTSISHLGYLNNIISSKF